MRIALANCSVASDREAALQRTLLAIQEAATSLAAIICFPECYLPGYRPGTSSAASDEAWLDTAWEQVDAAAAASKIAVILGTERLTADGLRITARITGADGQLQGFQDKVQLDPSEEGIYTPGTGRNVFQCGSLKFGVVICHEGWRYPEAVRSVVRQGAHVVFHPHFEIVENTAYQPRHFADPQNTFHEKAMFCRAAENTCYFASVNCALPGATTTSAVIDPDGRLLVAHPYAVDGLLLADIDLQRATGFLAGRLRPDDHKPAGA